MPPYLARAGVIAASHVRCREAGLDPGLSRPRQILTGKDLRDFRLAHAVLLSLVRPLLKSIHDRLYDQTTVLIFCDAGGTILDLMSAPEMLTECEKSGLWQGASLREESAGTNAVALSLLQNRPVAVAGEQHYARIFQRWFCAAAPVRDPSGDVIGYMDVSSDNENACGCAMALAETAALLVEKELVIRRISKTVPGRAVRISEDRLKVLELYGRGLEVGEIAGRLHIAEPTVKKRMNKVRQALSVPNARAAVWEAVRLGLIDPTTT